MLIVCIILSYNVVPLPLNVWFSCLSLERTEIQVHTTYKSDICISKKVKSGATTWVIYLAKNNYKGESVKIKKCFLHTNNVFHHLNFFGPIFSVLGFSLVELLQVFCVLPQTLWVHMCAITAVPQWQRRYSLPLCTDPGSLTRVVWLKKIH